MAKPFDPLASPGDQNKAHFNLIFESTIELLLREAALQIRVSMLTDCGAVHDIRILNIVDVGTNLHFPRETTLQNTT
jgi:hypothetical protein